jgi:hypothetical protein
MARKVVTFAGINGSGIISVPGVRVGDQILSIVFSASAPGGIIAGAQISSAFANFALVGGEILQVQNSDFTALTFAALLEREVMLP